MSSADAISGSRKDGLGRMPLSTLGDAAREAAQWPLADGLLQRPVHRAGQVLLTLRSRLLADAVVRDRQP